MGALQMVSWAPASSDSPDRAGALVFAVVDLMESSHLAVWLESLRAAPESPGTDRSAALVGLT